MNNKQFLYEGTWFDLLYLYQFLKRLITPFEKTEAFKLGIIDKNGKNLIKRKDFTNQQQRNAYTYFDTLVFNLKKMLAIVPGGKSLLGTFAASMLLLREEKNRTFLIIQEDNSDLLKKKFDELYQSSDVLELYQKEISVIKEIMVQEKVTLLQEMECTSSLPTLAVQTATPEAWRKRTRLNPIIRRASILQRQKQLPEEIEPDVEEYEGIKIFTVEDTIYQQAREDRSVSENYLPESLKNMLMKTHLNLL